MSDFYCTNMSIILRQDGLELLIVRPIEFRRIYTLDDKGGGALKYNNSDCIVALENESNVHLEIIQEILEEGDYTVKVMPTNIITNFTLCKDKVSMDKLKTLIFQTFPDIRTRNVYLNRDIKILDY